MHIGKIGGSTAGWQSLKERAMQGLTMFQEYISGVYGFLNNFVCVDKTRCSGSYNCRDATGCQAIAYKEDETSSMNYLEDYTDEEIMSDFNYTLYRPCNTTEEFSRACLYNSPCVAYILPDNMVELVCNCTPGWTGVQCQYGEMKDEGELGIHLGGFHANQLLLFFIILVIMVDACYNLYAKHCSRAVQYIEDLKQYDRLLCTCKYQRNHGNEHSCAAEDDGRENYQNLNSEAHRDSVGVGHSIIRRNFSVSQKICLSTLTTMMMKESAALPVPPLFSLDHLM